MKRFDIPWEDNYIGDWIGTPSRELRIRKVADKRYLVTLLLDGDPVKRPWMNDELTIDMPAQYSFDAFDGADFAVDLWPPGQRFSIHLNYEPNYELDREGRESLTMALSRDSDLTFLDQYSPTIGGLEHFVRAVHERA